MLFSRGGCWLYQAVLGIGLRNVIPLLSDALQDYELPLNVKATTSMVEAIAGAQYAIHAVPVQHSRVFLESIKVGTQRLKADTRCVHGCAAR